MCARPDKSTFGPLSRGQYFLAHKRTQTIIELVDEYKILINNISIVYSINIWEILMEKNRIYTLLGNSKIKRLILLL